MAYSESPFSSSSSSSIHRWNYDVFLSFRGEDTRNQFTNHLYSALIQAGIHTFRDDNELPRGEEISPQLLRAIEGSRISVVVFSRNYASSTWCLDELVKIMECRQKTHQVVLPIFYDTDPSDVRKQTGSYAKAFDEHEEHFKEEMEKVNRWRKALTQAANLSGWGLNIETNGYEKEFIKRVVNDVACKLGNKTLHVAKHPVGISSRVQGVISLLKGARNNVGIVGIHGIAGIGKTTIAKAVFNNLYFGFEGISFLSGVKEISEKPSGLIELQERLLHDILKPNVWKISSVYEGMNLIKERLHRKKVLVVFDDVDKREQLEALMGERCWFGAGSKIIVVTRNKHLLTEVEVDGIYHAMELDRDQSLQLFSLHAFRETCPTKDYKELSEKVVDYCKGLPLALKILGSHLSMRDKDGWQIDIAHWQNSLHDDIQGKLRASFDALDVDSSEIFLDIACFFVGKDKDYVAYIVGARYDCHPEVAFRALIGRSLIRINTKNQNRLWMHDIVQKMGREIIRQRSRNHPGNCSRIVLPKDAYIVLSKEMGTEAVEGLALDVQGSFSTKSFTKMRHLQLLQITGAHLAGSYSLLPRKLIWLCWLECPLKSLPSDFHLSDLVILDMQKSKVRKLWKGTKILNKLKILNLSYSKFLVKTPNCLGLSSLERLILVDCTSLVEVHQSIGNLKSLVMLNLEGCNSLKTLPESMGSLKSLQTLNVAECSQLEKFPESLGDLESLTELFAKGTAIKQLPISVRYLKKLTKLSFGGYKNVFCSPDPPSKSLFSRFSSWVSPKSCSSSIAMLPASFTSFSSLKELVISYAGLSDTISSIDFGSLSFLEDLDLSGKGFFNLPYGISRLTKLQRFKVACEMHDAIETITSPEQVQNLKKGNSLQRPSTNQADEPQGVSSPPKNPSCLGLGSYYDQICSPSVKHNAIMDDVHNVVKEKTEPIASMLEQNNAIQVGLKSLEQGAEEELICLHPEAKSGMENTCAEYIQHVDRNDSLEQTRLMESTSGRLVQPDKSASSTKLVGRASVKNAIWSCLMDDKVSIIGIYGMGGNGKTTMLKNICNELLERHGISHTIYWVNVPQDFRIDRSQDLIAERLYLNLSSKDDDRCSVVDLAKELMMKQKWILILNELWNSFDPQELGIPIPLNGSKFIMTTRSKMVCQQMNCQNSIRVDPLSDEEAWTLFMEKLGHDRQLSQEEKGIAEDAVRECAGLPLGIVTLAESLKGVHELHKWKITLKRLKESNFWDMEDQIFQILRLSYDCLDDSTKQCFVYCALFDESQKIERRELIESFIEEGIMKEFDKGHSILDSLENVCLLERIDDGKAVKMHDLLRDMAIQILADEYSLDKAKEERG